VSRDRSAWLGAHIAGPLTCGLADAAHQLVEVEGWAPLGFARLGDLARERFGRSGRWVRELAVLGRLVREQPALRAAIVGADGGRPLGRSLALAIARASTKHPLANWIAFARRVTVRELMEAVRADRAGRAVDLSAECAPGRTPAAADDSAAHAQAEPGSVPVDDEDELEAAEALEVRMRLPQWIHACFIETLDLHRAVVAEEASVMSFVEALAAEAAAGANPPDTSTQRVRSGIPTRTAESGLARVNGRWARLRRSTADLAPPRPATAPAVATSAAAEILRRAETESKAMARGTSKSDVTRREALAADASSRLTFLVHVEDRVERELGDILAAMARHGDWTTLGFASGAHYASERLGLPRRTAETRLAVANAIVRLPRLRAAYRQGRIGHEAAALLRRVLRPGTSDDMERQWVERAQHSTIKRLRDEVRMFQQGALDDLVGDRTDATGVAFPQRPATDAEWHGSLYRAPGRTRRKLQRCMPRWDDSTPSSTLDAADVFLRLRLPREIAAAFLGAVESERRRLTDRAEGEAPAERPDPHASRTARRRQRPAPATEPASLRIARFYVRRCRRLPGWVGLLSLLEDYADTWDDPAGFPRRKWDKTYWRDGTRCMAPGCTARSGQDDHHIEYRSGGGSDELWNQLCLCRFHHQQGEHGRFARVRGRAPIDVVWRLGTRGLAAWYRNEVRIQRPSGSPPRPNLPAR
jgi:hypothetical protein